MSGPAHPPLVAVGEIPHIDTARLFRPVDSQPSPIDNFIANTNAINKILVNATASEAPTPELAAVVVLGYLSAVETYFRTLLSRLAHVDPVTMLKLGSKQISFAVAMSRPRETLAEALYEDSFASVKELKSRLNEIGMANLPSELANALATYDKICHVRHCCVHRFGYLGTKNANDLGLSTHAHLVGQIFTADVDGLNDIADALQQFVKALNNHIFRFVTDRTVDDQNGPNPQCGWRWTWDVDADADAFAPFYDLFAVRRGTPPSVGAAEAYRTFRDLNLRKARKMEERQDAALAAAAKSGTALTDPKPDTLEQRHAAAEPDNARSLPDPVPPVVPRRRRRSMASASSEDSPFTPTREDPIT
ncbi:hypothetical protein [Antarcticirhabdus aurantiaca]|uniref:hypothetical protein n=1 Tax=Antarcticirhabdus aurantiaca TaxID=2606717 RepID=UPI00131D1DA2|nr:hypothetical protein [Antarcticirhabdus aurantiaca]